MTSKQVKSYFEKSRNASIRPELEYAITESAGGGTAIDCGCGAGANIAHLRARGFLVNAFDIDEHAISLCADRFANDSNVVLSVDSFGSFNYSRAALLIADASLFFCPADEFILFMQKMYLSLEPEGVFYGSFLGARDTMASADFKVDQYWGDVLVLTKDKIESALNGFEILQLKEHESDGVTLTGEQHHWHIFSVVAKVSK